MFSLSMKTKGVLTLIGGFFVMLMTGSIFLWGSINVYVTSYFRQKEDHDLSLSVGGAVFPLMTASLATGIPLGIKAIKFFGQARISLLISSVIASLMVILSSYTQKFYQFAIVYGVLNGLAAGTIYFVPIYMGYLHFPNNKGLVSGINTCGFALCSFIFGLIFPQFVNPDGLQQNSNSDGYSYFDGDSISVAQNVPESLRKIGYIFLSVSVVASQMVCYHPNQIGEEEKQIKKEIEKKQKEKKYFQNHFDFIQKEIKEIQSEQFKNQQQELNQQTDCCEDQKLDPINKLDQLRKSQEIITKQLKITEKEEIILQNQIQITHKIDEQAILPSINQDIIIEKTQQVHKLVSSSSLKKEYGFSKIAELIDLEGQNHNKEMHVNFFVTLPDQKLNEIEQDLENKEQVLEKALQITQQEQAQLDLLDKQGAPSVLAALKQPKFYLSIFLCILCLGFGALINGNYKSVAKDYGFKTDSFQTLVGSLGGIANGISRPFWATLLDKFQFKKVLAALVCIQIIVCSSFQATDQSKEFFAVWVFIVNACFGGFLAMLPVFSAQINGVKVGSQLFGSYWYGFSIANLIQFFLVLKLKEQIGFNNIFYIYLIQLIIALIITIFCSFKIKWSQILSKEVKIQQNGEENLQTTKQNNIIQT
ncbi:oxalate/formate antiporter family transporter (macronuclear) [Tetrahymena thermophila SB210]|uniref:Oxalate/formate antiporter family transporter n=1 Tax=Tetrahymena thermophila (strain SB210) TaxID=312017 RepID=Q23UB4_TETTS|nr:oxalate/formate antiporter family transporter [Tetrahymena thermophila SB210]EAS00151.3 oxalate/formate antiporter family transporter [Tetrahymena thermophila SB210]|eukprot:XP_001020396.3 oxalate/formate antiporter family transporter [Tetrahymena thermophila SB210]